MGDYLSQPTGDGGLGLGTVVTSVLFLAVILGLVVYLSLTRKDTSPARTPAWTIEHDGPGGPLGVSPGTSTTNPAPVVEDGDVPRPRPPTDRVSRMTSTECGTNDLSTPGPSSRP
jgi:hypothetical protein